MGSESKISAYRVTKTIIKIRSESQIRDGPDKDHASPVVSNQVS